MLQTNSEKFPYECYNEELKVHFQSLTQKSLFVPAGKFDTFRFAVNLFKKEKISVVNVM